MTAALSSMELWATPSMMIESLAAALASGLVPNLDAALWVRTGTTEPSGMRVVDVVPMNGIGVRVLPDRGLDLGQAWFAGTPLAWLSETGERAPLEELRGMAWGGAFGGGLLTTCGLRNVGMPSEGHGLHGTFSHLRASDVIISRSTHGDGSIQVSGRITDNEEDPELTVDRTITTWAGTGRIEITDVTTNVGTSVADAPLLYHFNFGWPVWSGSASLELDPIETVARDQESAAALDHWTFPQPTGTTPERVIEHRVRSEGGVAQARVSNPDCAVEITISWNVDQLPLVNQWLDANPGMAVLGVEPANCTTRGRAFERTNGTMPTIEPGQPRTTSLVVEAFSS